MSFAKIMKKLVAVVLTAMIMVSMIPATTAKAGYESGSNNICIEGVLNYDISSSFCRFGFVIMDSSRPYTCECYIVSGAEHISITNPIHMIDSRAVSFEFLPVSHGDVTVYCKYTSTDPDENGNYIVEEKTGCFSITGKDTRASIPNVSNKPNQPAPAAPSCNHVFEEVVTPATIDANGSVESKCTKCGKVETSEEIASIDTIKVSKATYNGKEQKPKVTIKDINGKLIDSKYYTLKYSNNKNAGKNASVKVTFQGVYSGVQDIKFSIRKANQNVDVNVSLDSVSEFWLKFFGKKGTITTKKAIGTVSYSSLNEDFVSIEDDGTFKIKRGTPKGEYGIVVTAKGDKNFKKFKKNVTIVVD